MGVLLFHLLTPDVMSSIEILGDSGEESKPDVFCRLLKYSFCRLEIGRVSILPVPVRRASLNGVKLVVPRRSLSATIVNGVSFGCDKYAVL